MAALPQQAIAATVNADDLHALQQVVQKFDRTQLIWSSGYLAGLAGSQAPVAAAPAAISPAAVWHVFYATETGNSRTLAEQWVTAATAAGLQTELHDLAATRPKLLKTVERAVFVIATHGLGEAPQGSETFFEYWFSTKAAQLSQLQYSVLALGDSSYADFCEYGRRFDARLTELGAQAITERVDCDLDFDAPADDWTRTLIEQAGADAAVAPIAGAGLSLVSAPAPYDRRNPFVATIGHRQPITAAASSKRVLHVEVDLEGSGLRYQPGDALAVAAQNPPPVVAAFAEVSGLSDEQIQDREITSLSRPILELIARHHPELQARLDSRDAFVKLLATEQLIDIAHQYPVDWQAPEYLAALRRLSPRSYSIASSPIANPDEAHLTVGVVDYQKFDRQHWGAASNFLASDVDQIPVYVATNDNFRLPEDGDTPIIMVGAGTGVAPYRAFVEHRQALGQRGANWLLFGDRNFASDFLYQLEWLRYRKQGLLTHLDVAFSRDQTEKVYVQNRLLERGQRVFDWLENGAHFYVCGDANRMAGDVHAALLTAVAEHGGWSDDKAQAYVQQLQRERRYQRDVY